VNRRNCRLIGQTLTSNKFIFVLTSSLVRITGGRDILQTTDISRIDLSHMQVNSQQAVVLYYSVLYLDKVT